MEYEVQRSTKHCAATGREFTPGEEFFSALIAAGADLRRADFSIEAWQGPPPGTIGWWKSQLPGRPNARQRRAPNEILLQVFDELADQPDRLDMRYVLALLLVRRRVMRLEEERHDETGREILLLYCPRRETSYEIPVIAPEPTRTDEIQQTLAKLLE